MTIYMKNTIIKLTLGKEQESALFLFVLNYVNFVIDSREKCPIELCEKDSIIIVYMKNN